MTSGELYRAMCEYLTERGWQREEPGSGWWSHPEHGLDATVGRAVEATFDAERFDVRQEPA